MKNLKILLILLLFNQNAYPQDIEQKIQGSWLISSAQSGWSENVENPIIYEGYLLTFDEGKLTIGHINHVDKFSYNYTIENLNIITDDSTVYEIVSMPPNTFRIRIDNGYLHDLIKIPFGQYNINEFNIDMLSSSSWIFSIDEFDYRFRLEFSKSKFENGVDSIFDLYSRAAKVMDIDYEETFLNWRYFSFQQQAFLSLSLFPSNSFLCQIIRYSGDTIYLKSWNEDTFVYPYLYKTDEINKARIAEIKEFMESKKWQAFHIDSPKNSRTAFISERIKEETKKYLENNIVFEFTGDRMMISTNETIIDSPIWSLTGDGKFIKLVDDEKLIGYLEIVEIGADTLTLRNNYYFSNLMKLNEYNTEFTIGLQ